MHLHGKLGHPASCVRHGMYSTKRELSILPLPLGEAGRRPGEGAFRSGTLDESTLTPALSQRERENENRQQRCKIRVAELVPNRFGLLPDFLWGSSMQSQRFARCCWCSLAASCRRVALAVGLRSQMSVCPVASTPRFLCQRIDERGDAHAYERALEASVARRAKARRTGSKRRPGWPT